MPLTRIPLGDSSWVIPAEGIRYKSAVRDDRRVRLVEFSPGFSEAEWCSKGHIGYVLEGSLEIQFVDRTELFSVGDVIMIKAGDSERHRARVVNGRVRLFLVEEA